MEGKAIQAILFDLGQTLLCFGRIHVGVRFSRAAKNAYAYLKEQGQPVPAFFLYWLTHFFGLQWHLLVSAVTGNDFDSLCLLRGYGGRRGFTLTQTQWQELNWRWYEPLVEITRVEPDLAASLKGLSAMGLKLGIVSNTFVNGGSIDRHLGQLGLLEFFPVRLYSCHFPWRKPDVRIFDRAAGRLDVQPEKILFVGDRLDTDVRGALAAGMRPVLKRNSSGGNRRNIPVIDSIAQLAGLVEKINEDKSNDVNEYAQSRRKL